MLNLNKKQNTMKKIWLFTLTGAILMFPLTSGYTFTKDQLGTSGAKFLQLGVNSRAIGMGEAYSSVSDGADSVYWNPAGLARVEKNALNVMHAFYFQTTSYDFVSYARHLDGLNGTLGIGVQYFSAGNIDEISEFGVKTGTFKPQDYAISVSWGHILMKRKESGQDLFVGLTGKFIQSKIINQAQTGAADAGVVWSPLEKWTFAGGVQNVGGKLKFVKEGDSLPLNVRTGTSYQILKPLVLALDLNFPNDNGAYAALGAEYRHDIFTDLSFLGRAGYNSRSSSDADGLAGVSAGGGLEWKSYGLDFAWVPFGELGNTYRVSLSAKF